METTFEIVNFGENSKGLLCIQEEQRTIPVTVKTIPGATTEDTVRLMNEISRAYLEYMRNVNKYKYGI